MRKIGVFICHCGTNIAQMLDIAEVVRAVERIAGVAFVQDAMYMCSAQGHELMKEKIEQYGLNGVVIASCSPKVHEETFRKALKGTKLNPYLLEIANIREHVSWCTQDKEKATQKAIQLIRMKVKKVARLSPLEDVSFPVTKRVLVIGGGIAGIEAALSMADNGHEVLLVEKKPSIGGRMAQFDKTFPTLDCAACILTPRILEAANHPKIRIITNSEVIKVSGFVGNFLVKILEKSRSVDLAKCNGCGICSEKCPVKVSSAFDAKLGERSAIYSPFPQAYPKAPVIDREHCLYFIAGKCRICSRVCPNGAIDYELEDTIQEERVGAIIAATGYSLFDAKHYTEYGYGRYPDVITNLQFERLISPTGPTGGKLLRPSDGGVPKTIVFVHCTGSRDPNKGVAYCSKICCMVTAKQVALTRSKIPDAKIYSFYIDLRTGGKNYEEFARRTAEEKNTYFIKGRVAQILPEDGQYIVKAENILAGKNQRIKADLVVLASGLMPNGDAIELAQILGIEYDQYGFYKEAHPKLKPVCTRKAGIYLAGTCAGPRDIPDSVSSGKAAAAKALEILCQDQVLKEPLTSSVNWTKCTGCFMCRNVCYYGAIERIGIRGKILATVNEAVCQGCGNCTSQCPSGAISLNNYTDEQIRDEIIGAL